MFEFWPPALFYTPVALYIGWLMLRFRGITLPTAVNPRIFAGGLVGESKADILDLVEGEARADLPRYRRFTPAVAPAEHTLEAALECLRAADIGWPCVAKPDIGERGAGVRRIESQSELADYLARFPRTGRILFQELVTEPGEAGVLVIRPPSASRARIFSLTLKVFPEVVGDGLRTLGELIDDDPRARRLRRLYRSRHRARLADVIDAGATVPLVFAGNHCQGTVFKNGNGLITSALEARFDALASRIPELQFARFDVRFADQGDFLAGGPFKIIEINGAGAEATHIWDADMGLWQAYTTLWEQWREVFAIGAENRRAGHAPMPLPELLTALRHRDRLRRTYPSTD